MDTSLNMEDRRIEILNHNRKFTLEIKFSSKKLNFNLRKQSKNNYSFVFLNSVAFFGLICYFY